MNLILKRAPAIYLAGFMASGKTQIGRLLAEELGWSFVDLDDDIEEKARMPIPQIFDTLGEQSFREIESDVLQVRVKQAQMARPMVVALGGGTFAQARNAEILKDGGVTVWLDCPFETVERRVAAAGHRPLARDPKAFRELYHTRRDAYSKANFRIDIHSDDPAEAVKEILALPIW